MKPIYRTWNNQFNKYRSDIFVSASGHKYLVTSADDVISKTLVYIQGDKNQDNYTIELCTGLKDVNDNWIYAGDIIKYSFDDTDEDENGNVLKEYNCVGKAAILFDYSGEFMFYTDEGRRINLWYATEIADELKVIGNIHENPELIKETKDESK